MSLTTTKLLLNPIRQSLCPRHYHSPISQLLRCRFDPWISRFSPCRFTKFLTRPPLKAYVAGSSLLYAGSMICISTLPPFSLAFAMDGHDVLVDDREFADSGVEVDWKGIWMLVRKMWVPIVFFATVFMNCYHPVVLLAKVSILLLATKPCPFSVYIIVDMLCRQSMRQRPYLYFIKVLYANKVEVQDYKLFCIAKVEVRKKEFTLVGILGSWWAFPLSRETISLFWSTALYLGNKVCYASLPTS